MKLMSCFIFSLALVSIAHPVNAKTEILPVDPPEGGAVDFEVRDEMPLMEQMQNQIRLENNINKLRAEGKLLPEQTKMTRASTVIFPVFPLRVRPQYEGSAQGFYSLWNFVDLDADSGERQDYTCGMQTYDGHNGIDYVLWPFPWWMMDQSVVEVVTAEGGTIVDKVDGQPDRSCPSNLLSTPMNSVSVLHFDGSVAFYGHMKTGSVTSETVGTFVPPNTYLGLVGSSGISTHPHLHFEFRENQNANSPIIEPHAGACRGGASNWAPPQRPFRDSRVNMVLAHHALPNSNAGCPNPTQETLNIGTQFAPGQTVILAVYISEELQDQRKTMELIRPDGHIYLWRHFAPADSVGAEWRWNIRLSPAGLLGEEPMPGTWRFRAQLDNGSVDETTFIVLEEGTFMNGFE